jgi:hypothetical protein
MSVPVPSYYMVQTVGLYFCRLFSICTCGVDAQVNHEPRPFSDLFCVPICFIPPVVPYLWQSTVSYIMESKHRRLVSWKRLPKRWNLNSAKSLRDFWPCRFLMVHISRTRTGELVTTSRVPWGGGHTHDGVLPGALKGSFATLLSPPQCHAAFGTMPHTLAAVDQSPVCRLRTLPLSATGTPSVVFWRGMTFKLY